jgi:hypothetical protein
VVDDPCWGCESLDHALPDGSEFSLSAWIPDPINFELNEVRDCNDHLSDNSLAVQHLEQVGEVGEWARLRVKRLEVEGSVTDYVWVENGARDGGGIA